MSFARLSFRLRAVGGLVAACVLASAAAASAEPAPLFKDRTADFGMTLQTDAACWVDFDNDGWADLCASGALWRNNAGRGFIRWATVAPGCVAADYDNDGFPDLFSWQNLKLYHNNAGSRRLSEVELPDLPECVSRGACWGDFNNDGFVDLYVGGYEDWDKNVTYPNFILMNEGGKSFRLAWKEEKHRSRGITACDFDQDGDVDVYVSNYRLQPNVLRLNDGKGEFKDAAAQYNVVATSPGFEGGHSIGAAWGDFDGDGLFDLFAGNFAHVDDRGDQPKSRFLRNLGPAKGYTFEDKGTCGVFYQESYATPAAGDYDNDGNLDLLFTTVYGVASFNRENFPVLYHNDGNFAFSDATAAAGVAKLPPTSQAAWADWDGDGDLDLVSGGKLFQNTSQPGNWLEVRLEGDGKAVNRSAIGTQVRVKLKERTLSRQVEAGTGEGNQNDLALHFGLGQSTGPVTLEILWPGGKTQTMKRVKPNQLIAVQFKGRR